MNDYPFHENVEESPAARAGGARLVRSGRGDVAAGDPDAAELRAAELSALELFATSDLALIGEGSDSFLHEAAVLKGNALGIIYDGDGSTDAEKVQRLLMLIPALLTVVDEARDTISRLRQLEERVAEERVGEERVGEERVAEERSETGDGHDSPAHSDDVRNS